MEKTDNVILLEEAKAGYARELANWNEFSHTFHNFFRSGGLFLTTIFIGIGFIGMDPTLGFIKMGSIFADIALAFLLISVIIITFSLFCAIPSIRDLRAINKINKNLNECNCFKNDKNDIISSLIEKYDTARREIVTKYDEILTDYDRIIKSFYVGFSFLVLFIIIILLFFISV